MTDLFYTTKSLKRVLSYLTERMAEELIFQGHKNTGNLINSFKSQIDQQTNGFELTISMDKYGAILNNGTSAARIPFSGSKGNGGTSLYIQALIKWIEQKGLESGDKEIKSFAFAIANTHKREGSPTDNSIRFSKTGTRVGWLDAVVKTSGPVVENMLAEDFGNAIESFIDNMVKTQRAFIPPQR